MKNVRYITRLLVAVALLATSVLTQNSASGQAPYDGFSAGGTTNATGGQIYTNLQYAVIPSSFTTYPVVKFVNARFFGSDITNTSARVSLYTSAPYDSAVTKITTATSAATNITADASFTNGVVAGDLLVHWKKATDTYARLRVAGPSSTLTGLSVFETTTTAVGDKLFKMSRVYNIPASHQTLTASALHISRDVALSGDLVVGPPGRPILAEAFGTNSPVLSIVTALPGK